MTVPHLRGLPMTQDPKLNCILALIAAHKAGAAEAPMPDVHGAVNTTNACNFFIVRKGAVWTSTGDYCMTGFDAAEGPLPDLPPDFARLTDQALPYYERLRALAL